MTKIILLHLACFFCVVLYGQTDTSLVFEPFLNNTDYQLIEACYKGDVKEVRKLIKAGGRVNSVANKGVTPLHMAVLSGDTLVVKLLLNKKAKVNFQDYSQQTPLHYAVIDSGLVTSRVLLNNGVRVDVPDEYVRTPLFYAVAAGDIALTQLLLNYKAEINYPDEKELRPLHLAVDMGFLDLTRFLLENGASANAQDQNGNSALHIAAIYGDTILTDMLIAFGADYALKNNKGFTPVAVGVAEGNKQYVNHMINYYNIPVNASLTPSVNLHTIASINNNIAMIHELKEAGSQPNRSPLISHVSIGFNQLIWDNYFMGMSLGLHELKYNINMLVGYGIRPYYSFEWFSSHSVVYNYNELLQYCNFLINKQVFVDKTTRKVGALFGGGVYYQRGKYRGAAIKPVMEIQPAMYSGLVYNSGLISVEAMYMYLSFDRNALASHWIGLNLFVNIPVLNNGY